MEEDKRSKKKTIDKIGDRFIDFVKFKKRVRESYSDQPSMFKERYEPIKHPSTTETDSYEPEKKEINQPQRKRRLIRKEVYYYEE